jgi:hypothetical protein
MIWLFYKLKSLKAVETIKAWWCFHFLRKHTSVKINKPASVIREMFI